MGRIAGAGHARHHISRDHGGNHRTPDRCHRSADRTPVHRVRLDRHAADGRHGHVDVRSIMAITGAMSLTFTSWDLEAMALAYRRPPGSRSPDVDPDGVSTNALGVRSALVFCRHR